jgi:hypothetical protein
MQHPGVQVIELAARPDSTAHTFGPYSGAASWLDALDAAGAFPGPWWFYRVQTRWVEYGHTDLCATRGKSLVTGFHKSSRPGFMRRSWLF